MLLHTRTHYAAIKAQLQAVQQGAHHLKAVLAETDAEVKKFDETKTE